MRAVAMGACIVGVIACAPTAPLSSDQCLSGTNDGSGFVQVDETKSACTFVFENASKTVAFSCPELTTSGFHPCIPDDSSVQSTLSVRYASTGGGADWSFDNTQSVADHLGLTSDEDAGPYTCALDATCGGATVASPAQLCAYQGL